MLVGADVTHPEAGSQQPSIVGITATHDPTSFKYSMDFDIQEHEVIVNFKSLMIEMLKFYKIKLNYSPEKIIYYRDGIGRGDFEQIKEIELNAIYEAFKTVNPNSKIDLKVTVILVIKRHHTRLFPTENGPRDERNCGNVLPGTVVDTIFNKKTCQYFMVSHVSPKGVSRPVRYYKLHDDSNYDIKDLEKFTFNLCHMYARCLKSVSYVTPTYYAHLAALRGKAYITLRNDINVENAKELRKKIHVHEDIRNTNPMYFI